MQENKLVSDEKKRNENRENEKSEMVKKEQGFYTKERAKEYMFRQESNDFDSIEGNFVY